MKKYLEAKERRKRRANAAPSDCTFTPIINKHVKTKSLLRKFSTNIKKKKRNNNNIAHVVIVVVKVMQLL